MSDVAKIGRLQLVIQVFPDSNAVVYKTFVFLNLLLLANYSSALFVIDQVHVGFHLPMFWVVLLRAKILYHLVNEYHQLLSTHIYYDCTLFYFSSSYHVN